MNHSRKEEDFKRIEALLAKSFDDNMSVNKAIKQDKHRNKRMKSLMRYSLKVGYKSGGVYCQNKKCAAIMIRKSKKRVSLFDNLYYIFKCSGFKLIPSVLKKEKEIYKNHPATDYYHLWFLGVDSQFQGKGYGTELLQSLCDVANNDNLPIYLETSVGRNIPFYEKCGFQVFHKISLGFDLFLLLKN